MMPVITGKLAGELQSRTDSIPQLSRLVGWLHGYLHSYMQNRLTEHGNAVPQAPKFLNSQL